MRVFLRLCRITQRERILLAALPELSLELLELIRSQGRLTVQEAVTLTGGNRNTIKVHLQKLVRAGHVVPHGAGRGVWYALA